MKRIILEIGTGNDLYGEAYTKAACRAVQDAIHHSSLILFRSLNIDHSKMNVNVTIGVQSPKKINTEIVLKELPHGKAKILVVKGGLNIEDIENNTVSVIATAAIEACVDINDYEWKLNK